MRNSSSGGSSSANGDGSKSGVSAGSAVEPRKRGRWDQTIDDQFVPAKKTAGSATPTWGDVEVRNYIFYFVVHIFYLLFYLQKTPGDRRWDETPGHKGSETPGATPGQSVRIWDATPAHASTTPSHETPAHEKSTRRNRWDETPKTERGKCEMETNVDK